MDSTLFVPLLDALLNLVSAVDAKWAAIVGLVLLLLRTGAIRFPFTVPFLKPKVPVAPVDPAKPVDPPKAPSLEDALKELLDKLRERFRRRLTEAQAREASAFFAALADDKLPVAEELPRHSE